MRPENRTGISNRKGERGNILAYTVLSAFFLFMAVGLGVDLSHLYLTKTELQNTADAAALAGASALKLAVPNRIAIATDRAVQIMNANKYNFNNRTYVAVMTLAAQRNLVVFSKNLDGNYKTEGTMSNKEKSEARFVRVTTPSVPVTTFFAIPILGFSKNLSAIATAGLSVPGNINACPTPLSAVSCPPNSSTCSLCDKDDPLYPNCTSSKYWGNCNGSSAVQTVPVGGSDDPDRNGLCDPKKEFCKGCTYNIRSGPKNNQGPAAGNFQILGCAGNGANDVRQALAQYGTDCPCQLTGPTVEVETQTGELAGAVRQGLNVRFDVYGAGGVNYGTDMPPDTNIAQGDSHETGANQFWDGISFGQYQGTATPPVTPVAPSLDHPGVANRRVLIVPIVPMDQFTDSSGHQTVRFNGLAGFFMRAQVTDGNGGDVQVEYIGDDIISVIGFNPNGPNLANIVTPVLYR